MDRINGANTIDLGGGKRGFRKKNKLAGIAGTELTETWCNGVQEEIVGVIEGAGLTPSSNNNAQLRQAIQALQPTFPAGGIIMWSGQAANIPAGWRLCDGTGGTPDLRNRFIIGAGSTYNPGNTGGSLETTPNGGHTHTGAIGDTALTVDQIPSHNHTTYSGTFNVGGGGATVIFSVDPSVGPRVGSTAFTGGSQPHSHGLSINAAPNHSHQFIPPFFALCFIMKT